jgi:hypothetical protein
MSNKNTMTRVSFQYMGPSLETVVAPTNLVVSFYQGQVHGTVDIPDTQAGGTEYDIPFGTIAEASMVFVSNRSGQTVDVKTNGSTDIAFSLPNGGMFLLSANALGTGLESIKLITTATQSGAGEIEYHVFGDPT